LHFSLYEKKKKEKKVTLNECVFFYGDDETKAGLTAAISLVGWYCRMMKSAV
jgi:hypothetical protein